jgi:hypothetical protein
MGSNEGLYPCTAKTTTSKVAFCELDGVIYQGGGINEVELLFDLQRRVNAVVDQPIPIGEFMRAAGYRRANEVA